MSSSSVAVRIQHHPSRMEILPRLMEKLDGLHDVKVVGDPKPDANADAWRAHRACLLDFPDTSTHMLVLQDDALPVHSFMPKMNEAIAEHPEALLLLFVPGFGDKVRQMQMAQRSGASWMPFNVGAYVPTVAIVYPRPVLEGFLRWADGGNSGDRYRRPMQGADDGILATYCRLHRIRPTALIPCLADHDDNVRSIGRRGNYMGAERVRRGPHRRAALL